MSKLEKLSQMHTLANSAHSLIYLISNLRWETELNEGFATEIDKICKQITSFCSRVSAEYEKTYLEEKKPF